MPTADTQRRARIQRLFEDVVDLPTVDRAAYFANASELDPSVLSEVEELVKASREAPGFLERPAASSELEGQMAGPWRIESLLASGGMADVYRAVRADTDLTWSAAVKVLKPSLDGERLSQRFRAEQRVLASLSHPNIVVLLDAGVIADGRLFLAMELIDGMPITRYCDHHRLGLRERLTLFLQCCSAVQYAHQRLIVHCDLKPSNVLVTRDGIPKLLDFGISTLLNPASGPRDSSPAITLGYASPEQLRSDVLAATTDVYSLGVMLYELIAGRRAFDVSGLTRDDVLAQARSSPAPLPSRDLSAVVMKALHQDAGHRYASVEQFAADIQRFLDHRPVSARPLSTLPRATKFLRRHRLIAAASVVVLASITFGGVGIYQSMLSAREEARLGWRAHTQAVQVSRFLEDMIRDLHQPSPHTSTPREELLDRAATKIESSFVEYPETEGRLRLALAQLYLDQGAPSKAEPHIRRAIHLISSHRGFGSSDRARATALLERATTSSPSRPSVPR